MMEGDVSMAIEIDWRLRVRREFGSRETRRNLVLGGV